MTAISKYFCRKNYVPLITRPSCLAVAVELKSPRDLSNTRFEEKIWLTFSACLIASVVNVVVVTSRKFNTMELIMELKNV